MLLIGRTMDWLIWSTMVLAGFIIGTMAMEIIMEMCKIISNVIKFRIEMFQLVLLPGLELVVAFMPPLFKTVSIEKINKTPVVITGLSIKTIIMDMCKITSNVVKFRIKMFQTTQLPGLEFAMPFMPPLFKTVLIEKINKNPVVLTCLLIKTIIMNMCKITSNIINLEYK